MKKRTIAYSILICGSALLAESVSGQVVAPPAPQQNAAKKKKVAPSLAMDIRNVNGKLEAQFTNNTPNEVGVALGKKVLRLKSGKSGSLAVPIVENLKIYDFERDGKGLKPRLRVSTMIAPQVGKRQFLSPK